MADGVVDEGEQNRLVAARACRPKINLVVESRERLAERWTDGQMAVLGLGRKKRAPSKIGNQVRDRPSEFSTPKCPGRLRRLLPRRLGGMGREGNGDAGPGCASIPEGRGRRANTLEGLSWCPYMIRVVATSLDTKAGCVLRAQDHGELLCDFSNTQLRMNQSDLVCKRGRICLDLIFA